MPHSSTGDGPAGSTARERFDGARGGVMRALAAVEVGERNSLERLRSALCTFVGVLREDGASKEQVIEIIRTIVATPATPAARFGLLHPARIALVELSINWCIEEYDSSPGQARGVDAPASPGSPGERQSPTESR